VEPLSRSDDVGVTLGESCVLLTNSSIASSITLLLIEDVNHKFNYMYEQVYFHYVNDVY